MICATDIYRYFSVIVLRGLRWGVRLCPRMFVWTRVRLRRVMVRACLCVAVSWLVGWLAGWDDCARKYWNEIMSFEGSSVFDLMCCSHEHQAQAVFGTPRCWHELTRASCSDPNPGTCVQGLPNYTKNFAHL